MFHIKSLSVSVALSLWNNFISSVPSITPFSFNPSLYNFYTEHFKWKPYYFLIYEADELSAVLPLVNTGKAWVSLPHFSYGGILQTDKFHSNSGSGIINKLISEVISSGLLPGYYKFILDEKQVETARHTKNIFIRSLNNSSDKEFVMSEKLTSLLMLPENKDELAESLSPNLNRKIRKAVKSGIVIKRGGEELLDDFYKVYSRNIFELNSLNYSKKFFRELFATYNFGDIAFFIAYKNDLPVGSGLLASYNGFYENLFFAVKSEFRKYYISDLLHWEMIRSSITSNNTHKKDTDLSNVNNAVYSFGRSTRSSGVHKYKRHWPVKDYPLYYYSNMPDIRKQSWLSKIWGILPYRVSQPFGAYFVKHFY